MREFAVCYNSDNSHWHVIVKDLNDSSYWSVKFTFDSRSDADEVCEALTARERESLNG